HRLVQFHAIAHSPSSPPKEDSVPLASPPETGNLAADLLKVLCAILAGHTGTRDSCWFCLWNGYGWFHDSSTLHGQVVRLPNRSYFLFKGPLDAATELGWTMPGGSFIPQSPNLFWPQDHAWCVASEIDLFCTLVAASEALAETIVNDPHLEAWRVFPGDPINRDSDKINT
ncbi:MAG: hypothetical protein WB992_10610, partial [Bryobacteraceae bacterium]